jgi:hypothetical protein
MTTINNFGIIHEGKVFTPNGGQPTTLEKVTCERCGKECIPSGCTTGYGITRDGAKHCFTCCADDDREALVRDGRAVLYLSKGNDGTWFVSNWPSTLRFNLIRKPGAYYTYGSSLVVLPSKSWHNIGRERNDVWFVGPDDFVWHGVNIGDNQILRCRITARKAR